MEYKTYELPYDKKINHGVSHRGDKIVGYLNTELNMSYELLKFIIDTTDTYFNKALKGPLGGVKSIIFDGNDKYQMDYFKKIINNKNVLFKIKNVYLFDIINVKGSDIWDYEIDNVKIFQHYSHNIKLDDLNGALKAIYTYCTSNDTLNFRYYYNTNANIFVLRKVLEPIRLADFTLYINDYYNKTKDFFTKIIVKYNYI